MKDVARVAGVSVGTVSKVFNGQKVGEGYRQRVLKAAKDLNFLINRSVKALRSGKSFTVALMLPDLLDPFRADFALKVFDALARNECSMLLFLTHGQQEEETRCLRQALAHGADGIIALCQWLPEVEEDQRLVTIDAAYLTSSPSVTSDNFGGGQLVAETLHKLGCRQLLGLQDQFSAFGERQKRLLGFELTGRSLGLVCDLCRSEDADGEPVWTCLRAHTQGKKLDYDGIFCTSDDLAYQVRQYLAECGISVPEQVQLIGYGGLMVDGMQGFACSTIRIPVQEMAETAVELVLGKRQEHSGAICLNVEYVPGKTTKGGSP